MAQVTPRVIRKNGDDYQADEAGSRHSGETMILAPADRRTIRAVLLQAGVPEREHAEHLEMDCNRNGIGQPALRTYRAIYGSFNDAEKRQGLK